MLHSHCLHSPSSWLYCFPKQIADLLPTNSYPGELEVTKKLEKLRKIYGKTTANAEIGTQTQRKFKTTEKTLTRFVADDRNVISFRYVVSPSSVLQSSPTEIIVQWSGVRLAVFYIRAQAIWGVGVMSQTNLGNGSRHVICLFAFITCDKRWLIG